MIQQQSEIIYFGRLTSVAASTSMTDGKRGGTMTSYNDKFDFEIGATEVQNKINEYVCSK